MPARAAKENAERLRKLVALIRKRGSATFEQIQKELGVHRSTIKRDIDLLRDRMGCPLEYDRGKKGWVIRDDLLPGGSRYELPGLWFNATEIYALLAMLHLLQGVQPGLLEPHIQPLKDRLLKILSETTASAKDIEKRIKLIHFASRRIEVNHFELLTGAVLERKRVVLRYLNRDKTEVTEREISPLQLVHYRENWLLDAWCHLRNGLRSFALDAMQQVAVTEKKAVEVSQEELAVHFESGYGIYAGSADKRAKLRFTKARAQYVSLEQWHEDQSSSWLPDGSYVLEVPYSKDQELVMDVLRYGTDVEVLEPRELRQRVAQELCIAAAMYGSAPELPAHSVSQ